MLPQPFSSLILYWHSMFLLILSSLWHYIWFRFRRFPWNFVGFNEQWRHKHLGEGAKMGGASRSSKLGSKLGSKFSKIFGVRMANARKFWKIGLYFVKNPWRGYLFCTKWPLEKGKGLEARAAHPHPNQSRVPPPPGDLPSISFGLFVCCHWKKLLIFLIRL